MNDSRRLSTQRKHLSSPPLHTFSVCVSSSLSPQFRVISKDLNENAQGHVREIFDNLERYSATLTGYAQMMNATWPFVVFPTFEVEGRLANQGMKSDRLTLHPLVRAQELDAWTSFSNQNHGWIEDAHRASQHAHEDFFQELDTVEEQDISTHVWTYDLSGTTRVPVKEAPYYFPSWQSAPAPEIHNLVNQDALKIPEMAQSIEGMLDQKHAVITEMTTGEFLLDLYNHGDEDSLEPHIFILQPVFDSFDANRTAVAFISVVVNWNIFFKDVLAADQRGITVILSSTCNQTATYVINGSAAVFLGDGHFHDEQFQEMEMGFDFADWVNHHDSDNVEDHLCRYHATILPTVGWRAQFYTYRPYVYTFAVVLCFVLTTLVFVLYDYLVQKRQDLVMARAKKTEKIVKSLFPENVRERLMNELQDGHERAKPKWSAAAAQGEYGAARDALTSEHIFGSKGKI